MKMRLTPPWRSATMRAPTAPQAPTGPVFNKPRAMDDTPSRYVGNRVPRMPASNNLNALGDRSRSAGAFRI